jgi:hypothetical protein
MADFVELQKSKLEEQRVEEKVEKKLTKSAIWRPAPIPTEIEETEKNLLRLIFKLN